MNRAAEVDVLFRLNDTGHLSDDDLFNELNELMDVPEEYRSDPDAMPGVDVKDDTQLTAAEKDRATPIERGAQWVTNYMSELLDTDSVTKRKGMQP